jgi:hypothetical protein
MKTVFLHTLCILGTMVCAGGTVARPTSWDYVSVEQLYKPQSASFDEKNITPIRFYGAENDQIIIPVKINGDDLWALVDTGSPSTTVSLTWAKARNISLQKEVTASGIESAKYKQWAAPIQSIDIGGFHQNGGGLAFAKIPEIINPHDGRRVDVIIGMDFISNFSLDINFDKNSLIIGPSGYPTPVGHLINIKSDNFYTKNVADIHLLGETLSVLVDTGSNGSVSLYKYAFRKIPLNLPVTDIAQFTDSGIIVMDYATVNGLKLDKLNITGPVLVYFQNSRSGGGGDGSVGLELLDNYNIFLDTRQRKLVLTERASPRKSPYKTNMGIQGNITDERWNVVHVMKNSPAAAVGLKDGDQICAVDGRKFTASSDIPRGPDGSTMHMALCDGRKIDLVRRSFY